MSDKLTVDECHISALRLCSKTGCEIADYAITCIESQAQEIAELREQCKGLAQSAMNNGEDLLRHEHLVESLTAENAELQQANKFLGDNLETSDKIIVDQNKEIKSLQSRLDAYEKQEKTNDQ